MNRRPDSRRTTLLLLPTLLLALLVALLVALWVAAICLALLARGLPRALALGLATLIVQGATVGILLSWLLAHKLAQTIALGRLRRHGPWIREQLAAYALGLPTETAPARMYRRYPKQFETCIIGFLPALAGGQRQRLSALVRELGLLRKWQRPYRGIRAHLTRPTTDRLAAIAMADPANPILLKLSSKRDEALGREAACAAATSGDPATIQQVLIEALQASLLSRVVVGEALKSAAPLLTAQVLPALLTTLPAVQLSHMLEMVRAWQRGLEIAGLEELARHPDPAVRARFLALLPYVALDDGRREAIVSGLSDPEIAVRVAACEAAARLRLPVAGAVATGMAAPDTRLRLVSAFSLARLGPPGVALLEAAVQRGGIGAAPALEALEKLRLGRLEGSSPA